MVVIKDGKYKGEYLSDSIFNMMLVLCVFFDNFEEVFYVISILVVLNDGFVFLFGWNVGGILYFGFLKRFVDFDCIYQFFDVMLFDNEVSCMNVVVVLLIILFCFQFLGGKLFVLVFVIKSYSGKGILIEFVKG